MKRHKPELFLLLTLVLAFSGAVLLLIRAGLARGERFAPLSSYRADKLGMKAFYMLMDRLDYPVRRRKLPVRLQTPGAGTLILAAPGLLTPTGYLGAYQGGDSDSILSIQKEEVDAILEWVEAGNTLWVLSMIDTPIHEAVNVRVEFDMRAFPDLLSANKNFLGAFNDWMQEHQTERDRDEDADEDTDEATAEAEDVKAGVEIARTGARSFNELAREFSWPVTEARVNAPLAGDGLSDLQIYAGFTLKPPRGGEAQALATCRNKPVAVEVKRGEGHVVLISDFYMINNAGIDKANNVEFLASVLDAWHPAGGAVYVDEVHHGLVHDEGVVGLMQKYSLHYLLLQAALLLGVAFWRFFPRDGEPETEEIDAVRNTRSYVASAAALYRRVIRPQIVAETLFREFWNKELRRLHLPAGASADLVVETLRERSPNRAALTEDLLRWRAGMGKKTNMTDREMMHMISLINSCEQERV